MHSEAQCKVQWISHYVTHYVHTMYMFIQKLELNKSYKKELIKYREDRRKGKLFSVHQTVPPHRIIKPYHLTVSSNHTIKQYHLAIPQHAPKHHTGPPHRTTSPYHQTVPPHSAITTPSPSTTTRTHTKPTFPNHSILNAHHSLIITRRTRHAVHSLLVDTILY